MDKVVAFMKAPGWLGMPWAAWCMLGFALLLNEIISWAKWTRAQGLLQGLARLVLAIPLVAPILARFPVVGWALTRIAGPDEGVERRTLLGTVQGARPPSGPAIALIVAALGFGVALTACTMTNAFRVVDSAASLGRSAYDLLFQIDSQKQHELAAEKATIGEEAAKAKVAAWRSKVDAGYKAIKAFTAAVVTAEATLNLIAAGQEKKITVGMVVAEVAKSVSEVRKVLEEFGVKVPFLSVERDHADAYAALEAMTEARAVVAGTTGLKLACIGGAL